MPRRPSRGCAHYKCPKLAVIGEVYCEEHLKENNRIYDKFERKYNHSERYDSRWERIRKLYIKNHPLCEECLKDNRYTSASLVHHKVPIDDGGDIYNFENLESVCNSCHQILHSKLKKT